MKPLLCLHTGDQTMKFTGNLVAYLYIQLLGWHRPVCPFFARIGHGSNQGIFFLYACLMLPLMPFQFGTNGTNINSTKCSHGNTYANMTGLSHLVVKTVLNQTKPVVVNFKERNITFDAQPWVPYHVNFMLISPGAEQRRRGRPSWKGCLIRTK